MKKNKMMRIASVLLVAVLLSTCAIFGTFAKYTTSVTSQDSARVAYWGFQSSNSIDITGLFAATYDNVKSQNVKDVVAPGTLGSASFAFAYDENVTVNGGAATMTGPEVAYDFTITVNASCDEMIQNNKNIVWKLDNAGVELTWNELIVKIVELSGATGVTYDGTTSTATVRYQPGELPAAFTTADNIHTIYWEWKFEGGSATYDHDNNAVTPELTQDQYDTYMGNMEEMDDVSIEIIITATQVN